MGTPEPSHEVTASVKRSQQEQIDSLQSEVDELKGVVNDVKQGVEEIKQLLTSKTEVADADGK